MRRLLVPVIAALSVFSTPIYAGPSEQTKYKYFNVVGGTAPEIHRSLLQRGPKMGRMQTYGLTSLSYQPSAVCVSNSSGKSSFRSYKFDIDFVINLPKLNGSVDGRTKTQWSEFASFAKTHEETHRRIWMGCLASTERKIMKLSAQSCGELARKADVISKKSKQECDRQHASFDAADQVRVRNLQFIRSALRHKEKLALKDE